MEVLRCSSACSLEHHGKYLDDLSKGEKVNLGHKCLLEVSVRGQTPVLQEG